MFVNPMTLNDLRPGLYSIIVLSSPGKKKKPKTFKKMAPFLPVHRDNDDAYRT